MATSSNAASMSLRNGQAPHAAADTTAIRELLDTYHGAINFADWHVLSQVFTQDAVWEALSPLDMRFDGHAAILEGLRQSVSRQELLVQRSSGILIDFVAPDRARVRSVLSEFGKEAGSGNGWRAHAVYVDRVVRDAHVWRFQQRTLYLRYQGDCAAPGPVMAAPRTPSDSDAQDSIGA